MNKKLLNILIICGYVSVPLASSVLSTFHLVDFFSLGNITWMSVMLACIFELGSITSMLSLTILDKINKTLVWLVFSILFLMQLVGNMYGSFNFINAMLVTHPTWLNTIQEMFSIFGELPAKEIKFIVAAIMAIPIPVISFSFLKSLTEYLKPEEALVSSNMQPEIGSNLVEVPNTPIMTYIQPNETPDLPDYVLHQPSTIQTEPTVEIVSETSDIYQTEETKTEAPVTPVDNTTNHVAPFQQ